MMKRIAVVTTVLVILFSAGIAFAAKKPTHVRFVTKSMQKVTLAITPDITVLELPENSGCAILTQRLTFQIPQDFCEDVMNTINAGLGLPPEKAMSEPKK